MALINCPECGNEVSKGARTCPRCGHPLKKEKKKHGCLITIIILIGVFILMYAIATNESRSTESTENTDNVTKAKFDANKRFDAKGRFKLDADEKTSAAVDEILSKAKKDCMVDEKYNTNAQNIALKQLKKIKGKYFDNLGNTEKAMYYGRILDLSNNENLKNIGWLSIKATKYVYRDEESEGDANVKKTLEKLNTAFKETSEKTSKTKTKKDVTEEKKPDLEIISYDSEPDGTWSYVVGEIKNNTNKTYSYVQVEINIYKGDALVSSTLDNVNNLEPGKIWKFKALVTEEDWDSFKIVDVSGF